MRLLPKDGISLVYAGLDLDPFIALDTQEHVDPDLAVLLLDDDKSTALESPHRGRRQPENIIPLLQDNGHRGQFAQFEIDAGIVQRDAGGFICVRILRPNRRRRDRGVGGQSH